MLDKKQQGQDSIDSKKELGTPKRILSFKEKADLLNRKLRVDVITQYGLDRNNFHYHWANDKAEAGSNVDFYEKIGYSVCMDKNNRAITRKGQGSGDVQYLMRIPIKEYNTIQHYRLDETREIEASIGKKNIRDLPEEDIYGEVKTTAEVIVK